MTDQLTFYSHTEIAEKMKVSEKTVVRQIKQGKLAAMKIGRLWRITDEAFDEFMAKQTVKYKRSYLPKI